MNSVRPVVDKSVVAQILRRYLGAEPKEITQAAAGQISSTFQCLVGHESLVVQFSQPNMAYGIFKERLFCDRLRAVGVPIREVLQDGDYEGLRYSIARKAHGNQLTTLPPDEFVSVLPALFDTLLAIASVDMERTEGFGFFDESGAGSDPTWQEHLSKIRDEEPGQFFGNWHHMFQTTFLEKHRFDAYYARMIRVAQSMDFPRQLVHGAFGYDNVLVHEGTVTAVLDWQDARFGDPLFDLAYLDYWLSHHGILERFERHCEDKGVHHDHFRERILVSKYYNSLSAMLFFAKINDRNSYDAVARIADNLEQE